jgi:hypothetical protein
MGSKPITPRIRAQVDQLVVNHRTRLTVDQIRAAGTWACNNEKKGWGALAWKEAQVDSHFTAYRAATLVIKLKWTEPDESGLRTVSTAFESGMTTRTRFMLIPLTPRSLVGVNRIGSFGVALLQAISSLEEHQAKQNPVWGPPSMNGA